MKIQWKPVTDERARSSSVIQLDYFAAQNLTQEDVFGEDLSDSSEDEDNVRRKRSPGGDLNGNRVSLESRVFAFLMRGMPT